ncbi:MAG: PEP-utilizing enzyme [Candidatus Micrarchaeota archaeon]
MSEKIFYKQYTLKVSINILNLVYGVVANRLDEYVGCTQQIAIADFERGTSRGVFVRDYIYGCGDIIAEKIIRGKLPLKKIVEDFDECNGKLQEAAMQIRNYDLKSAKNPALVGLYSKFCAKYSDAYIPASIPFASDFSLEKFASEELQREFGFVKSVELLTALSIPTGPSWENRHMLEMLEFAKGAEKMGVKNFRELKLGKLWKEFQRHMNKWDWLAYDYENGAMGEEEFGKRFEEALKNPEKEIEKIRKNASENEKKRNAALKEVGHKKGGRLGALLGELAYFKEYRKGLMSKALCLMEPLYVEIARRIGVELKFARYLVPEELEEALENPAKWSGILKERWEYSVYIQEGEKHKILVGDEAKKYMHSLKMEKPTAELKGTIACMGKVTGRVKILFKPSDMAKMQQGDIIVSAMTTPDLIPAIKKAAAIVTDTGGMTCHAAIVSREFNIPCIIGTQHATAILKDGDLVEVDATKGIIRKL